MKTRRNGNRNPSATSVLFAAVMSMMCFVAPAVWAQEPSLPSDPWTVGGDGDAIPSGRLQRLVEDLIAEITIVRDELGVYDFPPEAERQYGRAPVHAYVKTMEVLSKLGRVQNRLGILPVEPGRIPFKVVGADDVRANLELLLDEVVRIKTQLAIAREIDSTDLGATPTPELLYKRLGDASFLLDGLLGQPLLPDDVYLNASQVLGYIQVIAEQIGVAVELEPPQVEDAKKPVDMFRQARVAINKALDLQAQLGMEASVPPDLTLVRVTPSQVYDATNALLSDVARVKFQLGLDQPVPEVAAPSGMRPADVFGLYLLIIDNLDRISAAVDEDLLAQVRERRLELERQAEEERQRALARQAEEERQRELERQAEEERELARQAEEERQREAERQRQAELERQQEAERLREAELERQRELEELERQAELERQRQEAEALAAQEAAAEAAAAALPVCELRMARVARRLAPSYPMNGRRNLGNAVIAVEFAIDEAGEVVAEEVRAVRERSQLDREEHFERFAEASVEKVRDWSPTFEDRDDPSCTRRQTVSISFRFEY